MYHILEGSQTSTTMCQDVDGLIVKREEASKAGPDGRQRAISLVNVWVELEMGRNLRKT